MAVRLLDLDKLRSKADKPHRSERKWVNGWSPEQITHRLQIDFPDDGSMRIPHEAIYQALYFKAEGSQARTGELPAHREALRMPRAKAQAKAWAHVREDVMISSRPAEVETRLYQGIGRAA